ncbi:FMN-linked oxidoreductase [Trametopsis cervina]|nr:FMN-linked oxidoreductase [Trametopsis cervina]
MAAPVPTPALFSPAKVGNIELQHRVVLAPLTRFRATAAHVHTKLAVEYYKQRASVPGTMLFTEATYIAAKAGGYAHAPGIYTDEQVAAWKEIVDAVHSKGSFIFLQMWALGRGALIEELEGHDYVSASDVQPSTSPIPPRPLTVDEIKEYVRLYTTAASNAVHRAGFDGVEVHAANGYLLDQFIQDVSNKRTDAYGGSIENRARLPLEVLDAVTAKVGAEKVGFRVSPWGRYGNMRMEDPIPQFSYLIQQISEKLPNLAYIHVVEPRMEGYLDRKAEAGESNDFIRDIWAPRPIISAGAYTRELALEAAEKKGDLVAFGRYFISNPDLPLRLKKNLPLTNYDRDTFYDIEAAKGYVDYTFAPENVAELA